MRYSNTHKNMKYILTYLLLLFFAFGHAQFTKSNAKITLKPDGETLATLTDSTKIAIGVQENGWYPVTFKAFVAKSAVDGDSTILAEADLVNEEKDIIGKTAASTKVKIKQAEKRGFYKYYEVLVSGYIKGTNLHYRSIPEKGLEEILNDNKMAGRQDRLEAYFKKLGFVKEEHESYTAWAYLDEAGSLDQPMYRCIVIFRGETALYCIVSRHEIMTLDKLKDQKDHNTGKYYFYQRPSDRNWEEIKNIVYGFIPL